MTRAAQLSETNYERTKQTNFTKSTKELCRVHCADPRRACRLLDRVVSRQRLSNPAHSTRAPLRASLAHICSIDRGLLIGARCCALPRTFALYFTLFRATARYRVLRFAPANS
jgi:hypothetical protein